jgi:Fe-S-cluster containining protein
MELKMHWIQSCEFEDDTWKVTYCIPHDYGSHSYSEEFSWGPDYPPLFLKKAASEFLEAITLAVNERVGYQQKIQCGTCTGNCCKTFDTIRITRDDLKQFIEDDIDPVMATFLWDGREWPKKADKATLIQFIEQSPQSVDGTVGSMRQVPWQDDKKVKSCIFLEEQGCRIYEKRPQVCRNYTAIGCDIYEADPKKLKGLVQLRVKERDAIL